MSDLHPLSLSLALMLLAQRLAYPLEQLDTSLHIVLERYLPKWEDERVADLFARLKERLDKLDASALARYYVVHRECSAALCEHDDVWESTT